MKRKRALAGVGGPGPSDQSKKLVGSATFRGANSITISIEMFTNIIINLSEFHDSLNLMNADTNIFHLNCGTQPNATPPTIRFFSAFLKIPNVPINKFC